MEFNFKNSMLGCLSLLCVLAFFAAPIAGSSDEVVADSVPTPAPVVYEGNNVVVEGDPFNITCHLTVFDPIKWQRDEQTIGPDAQDYVTSVDTINGKTVATLSVLNAKHVHSGSYRCTALYSEAHELFVLSANSVQANFDYSNLKVMDYGKKLTLQCNITGTPSTQLTIKWFKDNKPLDKDERVEIFAEENKLLIKKSGEEDVGNYTCQAMNPKTNATNADSPMKAIIRVVARPKVTLKRDITVIEGERLKVVCDVQGNPPPTISWFIGGEPVNKSDPRIRFEADDKSKIPETVLVIDVTRLEDRNNYTCRATSIATEQKEVEATAMVRVKDKLAALWPFLGICAEVIVLCTVILIYEKKRNKAELDESDTDQSPEQKNTPDHGKDVRQRK